MTGWMLGRVFHCVPAGPMPKSQFVLDRHADEIGDGVLEFLGQVRFLRRRVVGRIGAVGGNSIVVRDGERAVKDRLVLGLGCG